jgi:phage-related protein
VVSISGTALVLSGAKTFSAGTTLNFVNPDEREVKVVCLNWSQAYADLASSTITATFIRVYEA